MHMVSRGGGSYSRGPSYGGGGRPMSPEARAAWKRAGVGALVLLPLVAVVLVTGVGWSTVLTSPLVATVFALVGLLTAPTAGVGALFGVALWGAAAGVAIGALRRARVVRGRLGLSFVGALFSSKLWQGQSRYPLLELGVRALVGYSIGLAFAAQGVFGSGREAIVTSIAVAAAGGPGGGGDGGLAVGYVILWLAGIIISIIVATTLTTAMMWLLLERVGMAASQGAVGGAAKELMIVISEDWGRDMQNASRRTVLKAAAARGAAKGFASGVLVSVILLVAGGS